MNNKILNISGVECYEVDGTAYLKLETVARGLGFITVVASGNECVRWNTVYTYLNGLGVATSCNGTDYRSMCPEYIPENIFYRLAMKAKNEVAEAFQAKIADEVIPAIRKTGSYIDKPLTSVEMFKLAAKAMDELNQRIDEANKRIDGIKDVVSLSTSNLREDSRKLIIKAANQIGGVAEIGKIYNDIYKIVEMKAGCNLSVRRENMKRRMLEQGLSPSKIKAVSNMDAIAGDKKLIEIFMSTVKDAAIMYGVA